MTRAKHLTPTRRALSMAGTATVIFSLVLSIAPVFAKNGNDGTVKIHDATTGDETGNDPHVCSFYAAFYSSDPLSGTWQLLRLQPGADELVEDGTWDTSAGTAVTDVFAPTPAHYRFEWTTDGQNGSKAKTLWVDEDCVAEAESSPSGEATPSEDESQSQEPTPSQESSPSGEATPSEDESQSQEPTPSQESSPSGEATPSEDESQSQEPTPSQESSPSGEATPSEDESQSQEPTPSQAPEGDQKDSTHVNPDPSAAPEGAVAPGTGAGPGSQLPDTAVPVTESGVLATIGLLLIIAAHAGTRRERQLPAA